MFTVRAFDWIWDFTISFPNELDYNAYSPTPIEMKRMESVPGFSHSM